MNMHSQKTSPERRSAIVTPALTALCALACMTLIPIDTLAQSNNKSGTTSGQFLKIGVGSRYLGMGEAAVATQGDAFSIYWNPAALSEIEGKELALAHTDWILDVSLSSAAYAWRWEGVGVLGFGFTALSAPELERTTTDDNASMQGTGEFYDVSMYSFQASFARELTPRFAFGGGIKYVHESILTESASAVAFDFGTMLYTGLRSLRMGMSISNLGGDLLYNGPNLAVPVGSSSDKPADDGSLYVESADLPLTFRFGMAYDVEFSLDSRFTIASEMKHPSDQVRQGSLGFEYGWKETFFLRSGYKVNYSEEGMTFGAGLVAPYGGDSNLRIDYAWSDLGRLQSAHRFSVNIGF